MLKLNGRRALWPAARRNNSFDRAASLAGVHRWDVDHGGMPLALLMGFELAWSWPALPIRILVTGRPLPRSAADDAARMAIWCMPRICRLVSGTCGRIGIRTAVCLAVGCHGDVADVAARNRKPDERCPPS